MQDVSAQFSVESHATAREVEQAVMLAWKKGLDDTIQLFTIGSSLIGGNDIIAGIDDAPPAVAWQKYDFFDESAYVRRISYERGLNFPEGGISKAMFNFELSNHDGRFLPDYMGGESELFTALLPQRPVVINAGFNVNGSPSKIPQVVGLTRGNPMVSVLGRNVGFEGYDFVDFLDNRYVDNTSMYTGLRTDQVIANILSNLGYTTSEYSLDTGINLIPFGIIPAGEKFANVINQLVKAEQGHIYQDELGVIQFANRDRWNTSPYDEVQRIIYTSDVLEARTIGQHKIINTVEIDAEPRAKEPAQIIFGLGLPQELEEGENEIFVDFEDPILEITELTIGANGAIDETGTDYSSSVSVKTVDKFISTAKYTLINSSGQKIYLTQFDIKGRPARITREIFHRNVDSASLTAYDPQVLKIANDYIQSEAWAETLSNMILRDYADPSRQQELIIRALPELQLGDVISWQGRYWRIFDIETTLDSASGFIQRLKVIKTELTSYFRIGISTIGGTDGIAP